MAWWNRGKSVEQLGSVLFRGSLPPRLENFPELARRNVEVRPRPAAEGAHWSAELRHPQYGTATLTCLRDSPLPPDALFDMDPRLTAAERADAKGAGSSVTLSLPARSGNVLRDRKDLLWFLRAVLADDGLIAVDHLSGAFWSRDGLDGELAHDAELDIDAIYTLHLVYEESADGRKSPDERQVYWLHSHGLRDLGFWDFDILSPSPDFYGRGFDTLRAIAFAIVEETFVRDGAPVPLLAQATICAVSARKCLEALPADAYPQYRGSVDESHLEGHAILCDPARGGWLGRLTGRDRPRPCAFFQQTPPDEVLLRFSTSATTLVAGRARQTVPLLKAIREEFAEFPFPTLMKLGLPTDDGNDHEHLWFEVHAIEGDSVDATLVNQPFAIASLKAGQRGTHPLEKLSDWTVMTPAGNLTPRETRTLRELRAHKDELREMLAREGGGSAKA